ncbi:Transcription elongation factor SPT6, partial [Goodea atripinnis]
IEYVTITPDGFRYRSQIFPTVNGLFRWFKDHYQEPVPDLTRAVNALPRNMTSQMFSAIAAVTGQGQNPNATPAQWGSSQYGYGGSTGGGGGSSSAYHVFATPQQPMATPMMTPSYSYTTPSQQPLGTPQPSSSASSSAVDWGKMAEQWLKEKEAEDRKKGQRMTPRPSPSPMIESTPMSLAGDATPLLDEMDR